MQARAGDLGGIASPFIPIASPKPMPSESEDPFLRGEYIEGVVGKGDY